MHNFFLISDPWVWGFSLRHSLTERAPQPQPRTPVQSGPACPALQMLQSGPTHPFRHWPHVPLPFSPSKHSMFVLQGHTVGRRRGSRGMHHTQRGTGTGVRPRPRAHKTRHMCTDLRTRGRNGVAGRRRSPRPQSHRRTAPCSARRPEFPRSTRRVPNCRCTLKKGRSGWG